jgi:hypothetical protein
MRSTVAVLFSCSALALAGCGANVASSSPDDIDSGVVGTNDEPDVADSGSSKKEAAPPGTPCVVAADCPTFVCAKCVGAALQECTGDHVCAT